MIFIGADIGTTRVKVLAYDAAGNRVAALAERATPVETTPDGDAHDANQVYAAVLACLADVIRQLPDPRAVAALGVASLGEEVVLADAAGEPLLPTPTWYESPGQVYAAQYGRPVNPTYSLLLLRWFAEHQPAASAAAVSFTDLGSYVASRLSGLGAALVMDHSHASRTGFFDVTARAFRPGELEWAGGWQPKAPRLVPSGTVIGELTPDIAKSLGLPGPVAVATGAHDHFAAAFASGVREPGDAMLDAGTSEALLLLTSGTTAPAAPGTDFGAFVDDHTAYLHRNVRAGHLFARWRELLHLSAPARDWFLPPSWETGSWETGAAAPLAVIDAERSTATLAHVPFNAEATAIMRALSEGLAVNARAMLADLEAAAGHAARTLTVSGPSGEQDAWLQLRAAVLGRPLHVVRTPEPTALGAALLAQRGLTGQADVPFEPRIVEPPSDPLARRYYEHLRQAYDQLEPA